MRIVLIGPPGAGKGTHASRLTKRFGFPHVSTGEMLRDAVDQMSSIDVQALGGMPAGWIVPDPLLIAMILGRIAKPDCSQAFVLDGFPRTLTQAESFDTALTSMNIILDAVVVIEIPDELAVERVLGRCADRDGNIFHLKFQQPPADLVVTQRNDDVPGICFERLRQYHASMESLVNFYEGKGIVRRIGGVGEPDEVFIRVCEAIGRTR